MTTVFCSSFWQLVKITISNIFVFIVFLKMKHLFRSPCKVAMRSLLPSWKRLGAGLGGGAAVAAAGLFCTSRGGGARLGGRSHNQSILTWRGTAAAAAGSRGSARWGGGGRRVTGDGPATVFHPVGRELDLVYEFKKNTI